jgi:8-hydroxy-5-deazaflavin:NADPH oxidoreductase
MQFGTIGAGTIGQAVGRHVLNAGHEVIFSNSRGPDSLPTLTTELGPQASAGTVSQAAAAEIMLLAPPWDNVPEALAGLPDWTGRIVIDATNQLSIATRQLADLGNQTGSEYIASLLPGARVIKAFNTLYARHIAPNPRHHAGRQLLFYAGDDTDAKTQFHSLFDSIGFAPVDIGPLRDGGRLMQMDGGPLSALHALKQH